MSVKGKPGLRYELCKVPVSPPPQTREYSRERGSHLHPRVSRMPPLLLRTPNPAVARSPSCLGVMFRAKRSKYAVLLRWCRTSASLLGCPGWKECLTIEADGGRWEGSKMMLLADGSLVANLLLISEDYAGPDHRSITATACCWLNPDNLVSFFVNAWLTDFCQAVFWLATGIQDTKKNTWHQRATVHFG